MRKEMGRRKKPEKDPSRTSMANLVDKRASRAEINEKPALKQVNIGISQTTISKGVQQNSTSPARINRPMSKIETGKIATSPTRRQRIASWIDIEDECDLKNWKNVIEDEKKATNKPGFQVYSVQGPAGPLLSIKDINVADLEIENVIRQDKPS
jgi:hypothetical protein